MARVKEKIIYQAPKKTAKKRPEKQFSVFTLFLPIVLLSLVFFAMLGLQVFQTPYARADETPTLIQSGPTIVQTPVLYPTSLLTTPTPTPSVDIPISSTLEQTLTTPVSSDEAKKVPPLTPDYCLNVPMIMYHHVQPLSIASQLGHEPLTVDSDIFDGQMKYLKENGYTALSVQDLVTALYNRGTLPEKSVIITIDDGYDDNYTYAFMSAKKYQFLMNFMIPTGLIGTPGYMTWDHLHEMVGSPYARIYNHTTSHAALGLINKDQILSEVTKANADLSSHLGLNNTIVVYPYGSYNDEAVQDLKDLGMTAAVSTDPGTTQCLSNIMKLPRVRVGNEPISNYGY